MYETKKSTAEKTQVVSVKYASPTSSYTAYPFQRGLFLMNSISLCIGNVIIKCELHYYPLLQCCQVTLAGDVWLGPEGEICWTFVLLD